VLLADDEETFRSWLRPSLEQAGYDVVTAADGLEALSQVRAEQPDLILLDVMMPRMDGFEVLTRLKSDPNTAAIPVVLLIGMPAEARAYTPIYGPGEFYCSDNHALVVIKPLLKDPAELIRLLVDLRPLT
jgi:CheY-like chemotaxis protein